ncbi:dephospho-CoA kinase [Methylothermus subterraneus]
MLKIGLTGGIGSGKSTVAQLFERLGVPVIDADRIARELVEPGRPALKAIQAAFGSEVITPDGRLDRAKLRANVFADASARKTLEAILHPPIFAEMERRSRRCAAPYGLLVIPLLIETKAQDRVDRVLVVDCPEALQIERIRRRDRLPEELILNILASQASRAERLEAADEVICNTGNLRDLERQVEELHRFYLRLSGHAQPDPTAP